MTTEPDRKINTGLARLIEQYDNAQRALAHRQQEVDRAISHRDVYQRGFDAAAEKLEEAMLINGMAKIGHEAYLKKHGLLTFSPPTVKATESTGPVQVWEWDVFKPRDVPA